MGEEFKNIRLSVKSRYSYISDEQFRTRIFGDEVAGLRYIRAGVRDHHEYTVFLMQDLDTYLTQMSEIGSTSHLEYYVDKLLTHKANLEYLDISLSIELYNIALDPAISEDLLNAIFSLQGVLY
jgi:hypothetical protein